MFNRSFLNLRNGALSGLELNIKSGNHKMNIFAPKKMSINKVYYVECFKKTLYNILSEYIEEEVAVMISGGSLLELFDNPDILKIDTSRWSLFFADERVSVDEDKNYIQATRYLGYFKGKMFQIRVDYHPEVSIRMYQNDILPIKLCILGIGGDGHIASIFPFSKILDSNDGFIHINDSPKPPPERITITPTFINSVERLIFIVPPKNGIVKDVTSPHESILRRIKIPYEVYLDKRLEKGED
jgi:6-phosphogluconolactonase